MSHFMMMVLVPKNHEGTVEEALARVLQPWHEFECTGTDDKYVQDLDKTEEARANYEDDEVSVLVDPAGVAHCVWNAEGNYKDEFSEPNPDYPRTGGRRTLKVPDGWVEAERPAREFYTFREWAESHYGLDVMQAGALLELQPGTATDAHRALPESCKFGYILVDDAGEVVKVVRRTNPNKKWDWWTTGGRWSGKLIDKKGEVGDGCEIEDLDLTAMREASVKKRQKALERAYAELMDTQRQKQPWASIPEIKNAWARAATAGGFPALTAAYKAVPEGERLTLPLYEWAQTLPQDSDLNPVVVAWERGLYGFCGLGDHGAGVPEDYVDVDVWALEAPPLTAWGVVDLEGRWHEKGEMGWFGMSTPTEGVSPESWEDFVMVTLKSAPAGTVVAMVDCHI